MPGHLREREIARLGTQFASEWIRRNPEKLPVLAWRASGPDAAAQQPTALLLLLALAGLLSMRRSPLVHLLAALVAINALAVMATYTPNARYLFPARGSLYVLAAVGLACLGRWLLARSRRRLPTEA